MSEIQVYNEHVLIFVSKKNVLGFENYVHALNVFMESADKDDMTMFINDSMSLV
jgi:hypothetical protein